MVEYCYWYRASTRLSKRSDTQKFPYYIEFKLGKKMVHKVSPPQCKRQGGKEGKWSPHHNWNEKSGRCETPERKILGKILASLNAIFWGNTACDVKFRLTSMSYLLAVQKPFFQICSQNCWTALQGRYGGVLLWNRGVETLDLSTWFSITGKPFFIAGLIICISGFNNMCPFLIFELQC